MVQSDEQALEEEPWSKGLVRDFREEHFAPVVSDLVAAEIAQAPDFVQAVYKELVELDAEVLSISELSEVLVRRYLDHGIVPERFQADAGHIALATVGQVDIVVSWNFRHIVRFDKIRMFNAANRELGYKEVEIYSPREVTRYEEE